MRAISHRSTPPWLLGLLAGLVGCAHDGRTDATVADGSDAAVPLFVDAACGATYARHDPQPGIHVPAGTDVRWRTNPPSSGEHYDQWTTWGEHAVAVPRGNWVHNLEHGGVALLYRCDEACANTRAQLAAFMRSLPPETAGCAAAAGPTGRRILITEDPLIESRVAAAAWGATYRADCVDLASLRAFVLGVTGLGPESVCLNGTDVTPLDGGRDAASVD